MLSIRSGSIDLTKLGSTAEFNTPEYVEYIGLCLPSAKHENEAKHINIKNLTISMGNIMCVRA